MQPSRTIQKPGNSRRIDAEKGSLQAGSSRTMLKLERLVSTSSVVITRFRITMMSFRPDLMYIAKMSGKVAFDTKTTMTALLRACIGSLSGMNRHVDL